MRALIRGEGGGDLFARPPNQFQQNSVDFGQVYSNGASLNQLLDTKHS